MFHQTLALRRGHVIAELRESIERQSPTILEHRCKQSCSTFLCELGSQQVSACYTPVGKILDVETQACRCASMVLALRLQLSSWRGTWLCCIVRGCDHNRGEMRHVIAKMGVLVTPLSPPRLTIPHIVKGIIPPEDGIPPEGKVPPATGIGPG